MQKIFVIMDSLSASGAKATLLSSNMIVTKIFNKSAIVEFDVEANKLGKNKYYIFTSAGDMKEITFEVVNREVGTISQSDASFSEGKINDIILDFSNLSYNFLSSANYFSYKIADVASEKRVLHAPLSNVIVPMLMTSSGIKLLSLSLFDANISNIFSFSKPIFIKSKSEVRIDKINFFSNGNGKNVVELFIKKDPAIKKVFLVINKQIYNLVSDSIIFSVENKTQSAKLTWVDSYNSKGDKAFLLRQTNGNDSVFSTTDFSPDNTQESLTFIIFLGLASLIILTFIDIIRNHSYLDRIFKK